MTEKEDYLDFLKYIASVSIYDIGEVDEDEDCEGNMYQYFTGIHSDAMISLVDEYINHRRDNVLPR